MSIRARRIASIALALAIFPAAKCGGDSAGTSAATDSSASAPRASRAPAVKSQSAQRDPCSWISRADAQRALGDSVISEPMRVRSPETPVAQPDGSACAYELAPRGGLKQIFVIALSPDESGVMQSAFGGMGNVEKEFESKTAHRDTLIDGRWDFVSEIPGGLTAARAGRIAVELVSPVGRAKEGLTLAGAMLDRVPDLPFTSDPANPSTPPRDPSPCALITRAEAEAVLGPLAVAPYASGKNSALVFGSGTSCAYYTGKHRALVVTPMLRHGAEFFRMMGGVTTQVNARMAGSQAPDTLEGNWDALSIGSDGALHALKGDKMLSLQYKTSSTDFDGAVKLVRAALARL
jgi:hypothetical protein